MLVRGWIGRGLLVGVLSLAVSGFVACGDDDDDGSGGGGGGDTTTVSGNLSEQTALLDSGSDEETRLAALVRAFELVGTAWAQVGGVEVCVDGTDDCDVTSSDGTFSLVTTESGLITLRFTGTNLDATMPIPGPPGGGTVQLQNVSCSESGGACSAGLITVQAEGGSFGPVSCQSGPVTIVPMSQQATVDGGNEKDCLEAGESCSISFSASGLDLTLQNCVGCIDASGGGTVDVSVEDGSFSCQSDGDGIVTTEDSQATVDVTNGNLTVTASGENGIWAQDTSMVTVGATGSCTINGGTNSIRQDETASVDASGCEAPDGIQTDSAS